MVFFWVVFWTIVYLMLGIFTVANTKRFEDIAIWPLIILVKLKKRIREIRNEK